MAQEVKQPSQSASTGTSNKCVELTNALSKKKGMLLKLEEKLDEYLQGSDCDLSTIDNTSGLITSLKTDIADLESQLQKSGCIGAIQEPLNDPQSVISSSVGGKKLPSEISA
jgi:hypothetical protein